MPLTSTRWALSRSRTAHGAGIFGAALLAQAMGQQGNTQQACNEQSESQQTCNEQSESRQTANQLTVNSQSFTNDSTGLSTPSIPRSSACSNGSFDELRNTTTTKGTNDTLSGIRSALLGTSGVSAGTSGVSAGTSGVSAGTSGVSARGASSSSLFGINLRDRLSNHSSATSNLLSPDLRSHRSQSNTDSQSAGGQPSTTTTHDIRRIASSRPPIKRPFIRALHDDDNQSVNGFEPAPGPSRRHPTAAAEQRQSEITRVPNVAEAVSDDHQAGNSTGRGGPLHTSNIAVWNEISQLIGRLSGVRG